MSVIRLLHGDRSTPVSRLRLGAGIYVSILADGTHEITTTPTEFGGQTPEPSAIALQKATDGQRLFHAGDLEDALRIASFPSAATQVRSIRQTKRVLEGYRQARIIANVISAANASAKLAIKYSLDNGETWNWLDGVGGPIVTVATIGTRIGEFAAITLAARTDVMLGVFAVDGDGVSTLLLASLDIEFAGFAEAVDPPQVGEFFSTANLRYWFESTEGVTLNGGGQAVAVQNLLDGEDDWTSGEGIIMATDPELGVPVWKWSGEFKRFFWPLNSGVGRTAGTIFVLVKRVASTDAFSSVGMWVVGGQGADQFRVDSDPFFSYGSTVYRTIPRGGNNMTAWNILHMSAATDFWQGGFNGLITAEHLTNTYAHVVTPYFGIGAAGLGMFFNGSVRALLEFETVLGETQFNDVIAYLNTLRAG